MGEFSHHPSAGMDPEDDLPHGRGPESVRRFDDHHMTAAYPRAPLGMVNTVNGWQPMRGARPWSPAPKTIDDTATEVDDLSIPIPPEPRSAGAERVVEGDPPQGIFRMPTFWRRVSLFPITAGVVVILAVTSIFLILAAVRDGVDAGIDGVCESIADRFQLSRTWKLFKGAWLLGWRGR